MTVLYSSFIIQAIPIQMLNSNYPFSEANFKALLINHYIYSARKTFITLTSTKVSFSPSKLDNSKALSCSRCMCQDLVSSHDFRHWNLASFEAELVVSFLAFACKSRAKCHFIVYFDK